MNKKEFEKEFDVTVIGAGPGAQNQGSSTGMKVVIIETKDVRVELA